MQTSASPQGSQDSSAMVSWFINQAKAPLRMDEKEVGGHKYYLCSSGFEDSGRFVSVCGRGATKLQAATRCIGEWLERKAAFEFFENISHSFTAYAVSIGSSGGLSISNEKSELPPLPMEFWTTNGWAIHTEKSISVESSFLEALERSLLVSSFLHWGWDGFILAEKTSVDGVDFSSCVSRYRTEHYSAGFSICRDPVTQGLSFGHFADKNELVLQSPKWAQALYESMDKLGTDLERAQINDPLAIDAEWYLKNKIDLNLADSQTEQEKIKFSSCFLHTEDLSKKWNLPFPLFSSFVFGGDLMPLFIPRELTEEGHAYLSKLSNSLGFAAIIPERIPVL